MSGSEKLGWMHSLTMAWIEKIPRILWEQIHSGGEGD